MRFTIFKLKIVFSGSLIILEAVEGTDKLNAVFAKDSKVFLLSRYFFGEGSIMFFNGGLCMKRKMIYDCDNTIGIEGCDVDDGR